MRFRGVIYSTIAAGAAIAAATTAAAIIPASAQEQGKILIGAGDIASVEPGYSSIADDKTAPILNGVVTANPDATVFVAGDASQSSKADYTRYDQTWGVVKSRTRPAPGNHDYMQGTGQTRSLSTFAQYFGSGSLWEGTKDEPYYSYDVGDNWHVFVLDSNCESDGVPGGCGSGSRQADWLINDALPKAKGKCIAAYWHHPVVSRGKNHPGFDRNNRSSGNIEYLYNVLYNAGADVVMSGHNHVYERYDRLGAGGSATAGTNKGIRQFVVGTGGMPTTGFANGGAVRGLPESQASKSENGVLKLTLKSNSYEAQFIGVNGNVLDAGTGAVTCHPDPS